MVVLWCWKPGGRGSIPGWAASSFTLVGYVRMKNVWLFSNWHCGFNGGGRGSIPSWAKSTLKLVSEWMKKD